MRLRLQPRRRPQGKRPPGKLNVALLSLPAHHLHFSTELAQRLDNLPIAAADDAAAAAAAENASVENRWCQLRDTIQSTALAVLGRAPRQHQNWFDDNDTVIGDLLAEKNGLHKAYVDHPTADNKAAFYRSRRQLQQRLREMQDAWTARKAEEIQGYVDRNEWKNFFSAIKAVYGPPTKGTAPLLSADGSTLLTEKTQILQRRAEHFRGVLNRPSAISDAAIDRLPQVETDADHDLPPSLQETIRAVQQLSSGKAPGSDAIPAEVYKHGGPQLMDHLTVLFQEMWRQGEVPQDFKDATIVHLYKRKGNRQICDNHRGISLLNIAGKIFARILLNRLNNHLEQGLLPESQCGFRRHRGTTDIIFAARQLQEKCQEMRTHLYSTFVDLTKAFDTVNREGLWKIMQKFGCPERFIQMVRQLHDGMMARVTDNGAVSEEFAVTSGVKQGCVLAPTLFSLMFSAMLMDAYRGDERPRDPHRLQDGRSASESTTDALPITCLHHHASRTPLRRRLRPEHHLGRGDATEHGPIFRRLRELRPGHQHAEDSGDAPTATQLSRHSPQRAAAAAAAANQCERNPTASGGELPVPGEYSLPQHHDRRRSRQHDLESQSSFRSPTKHSLVSSRSSTKHEAEDVENRHSANATVWSGDLDCVRKAGTPSEPLPPQLPSSHPEAELAGPNSRH
ncbi:hypothetical protein SprV_0100141600 [Sparganum proliferum]